MPGEPSEPRTDNTGILIANVRKGTLEYCAEVCSKIAARHWHAASEAPTREAAGTYALQARAADECAAVIRAEAKK